MLQIEDYDKLDKVSKGRLDNVLQQIEGLNMRFPLAEIVRGTNADKGMVSAYLNGKKPISDKFYSTFMQTFSKEVDKIAATPAPPERPVDITVETIRELARSCVVLSDAVKLMADNNRELIQMQKVNSAVVPDIRETLYPYLEKVSKVVAKKYHLKSDDVLAELGRILVEDVLGKKGQGNVAGSHSFGK